MFPCTWNNPFSTHVDLISKAVEGSECKKWQPADRPPAAMGTPAHPPPVQREGWVPPSAFCTLVSLFGFWPWPSSSASWQAQVRHAAFCWDLTVSPRPAACRLFLLGLGKAGSRLRPCPAWVCRAPPAFPSDLSGELLCLGQLGFFPLCLSVHLSVSVRLSLCVSLCLPLSLCRVPPSVTPWTAARQAPLSMEFSRQGYWTGLSFPPPGDLTDSGIEPASLGLSGRFLTTVPPGKRPYYTWSYFLSLCSSVTLSLSPYLSVSLCLCLLTSRRTRVGCRG